MNTDKHGLKRRDFSREVFATFGEGEVQKNFYGPQHKLYAPRFYVVHPCSSVSIRG